MIEEIERCLHGDVYKIISNREYIALLNQTPSEDRKSDERLIKIKISNLVRNGVVFIYEEQIKA